MLKSCRLFSLSFRRISLSPASAGLMVARSTESTDWLYIVCRFDSSGVVCCFNWFAVAVESIRPCFFDCLSADFVFIYLTIFRLVDCFRFLFLCSSLIGFCRPVCVVLFFSPLLVGYCLPWNQSNFQLECRVWAAQRNWNWAKWERK